MKHVMNNPFKKRVYPQILRNINEHLNVHGNVELAIKESELELGLPAAKLRYIWYKYRKAFNIA